MAASRLLRPTISWTIWLRVSQGGLLLGLAVLAAHDIGGLGHGNTLLDRWLYDGIEAAAALGCLLTAALRSDERAARVALGLAILATTSGDALFDFAYHGSPPFPSAADAGYLAFYPFCYVGLGLLLRSRVSRFGASVWLDGLMAGLAAAALGGSVILHVVVASTHGSPMVVLTNMAYPLGDIVLLAMVVFVFTVHGWRPSRGWWLVDGALILNTVGDGVYLYESAVGTYVEGTWLDVLWPTSMVLLALSMSQARVSRPHRVPLEQRPLLGTPLVCGLVGIGVLVAADGRAVHPLAVALAAATILLVLIRTALTFHENSALLQRSRRESLTDALTGLSNRRQLLADLEALLAAGDARDQRLLAVFDLNGFKDYNDSFGHPAGDALLARLGAKLAAAVAPDGSAYRMGGDEFCALLPVSETHLDRAAQALVEHGDHFTIASSFGAVAIPEEASDSSSALSIADQRLYRHKEQQQARRGGAHELLLRTLEEREPGLREHVASVASLAVAVARRAGLGESEIDELRLAAELHDVGKLAVPDAVLEKPGPLNPQEWQFIRQHTLIGQRILSGVPALAGVGRIVRATHERWDGSGYPDNLAGPAIPLAARIIAVCDAFSAITSDRPYGEARTQEEAVAELRRCAGHQFDPDVVAALGDVLAQSPVPTRRAA